MGSDNQAMWRSWGIHGRQGENVASSIVHPCRPNDRFYFIPDPVHNFKNFKLMLQTNQIIKLPLDVVAEAHLFTNEVKYSHIMDLQEHESKFELKVAYRLKKPSVQCSGHFEKMKVQTAKDVINNRTSSGLKLLADYKHDPTYLTTAWFIDFSNHFFEIITSRNYKMALSKNNMDVYLSTVNHIKKFEHIIHNTSVGKGAWKPCQAGIRILCFSVVDLQEYYLNKVGYNFLLLGRFTQDSVENLFSCIRLAQPVPNVIAFKQNLKVITIAQFCSTIKGSYSYDPDEGYLVGDFLTYSKKEHEIRRLTEIQNEIIEIAGITFPQLRDEDLYILDEWEWFVIYDMAGVVLRSVKKNYKTCETCFNSVLWHKNGSHPFNFVVQLKNYTPGALIEVSHDCFKAIMKCEITFRKIRSVLLN